ncbi:MAG: S24/S26 family peptidase [Bacteroidales bacterium]|nr:S24/S26 family peptidase [Bacteroidales bacterium]
MSEIIKVTVPVETLLPSALEFLKEGMSVVLPVKGNSMLPYIRGGKDQVLVRKMPYVREGDVVLAHTTAGNYVIHRIIEVKEDCLVLRGDGNLVGTEKCTLDGVVGTVVEIQKPSGHKLDPYSVKGWQKLPLFLRRILLALYKLFFRP